MTGHDFMRNRASGLGGTDAAAALGVSRWKSPLDVYLDKRGEAPPVEDNAAMYWGRTLEPIVREEYERQTGSAVVLQDFARSVEHPFMVGHLDGRRADDGRVVEIKTARSADNWGEPGSADIPADYIAQTHHYMLLTGARRADVAVLIAGSDFRVYTIPFDAELGAMIVDAERELWDRIVRSEPPEPRTLRDVANLYRHSQRVDCVAPAAVYEAWQRLIALRDDARRIDADAEALEVAIKTCMADADTLLGPDGKVLATWKQRAGSTRLDSKRLRAEAPEVYERFAAVGEPTRTFLIKEPKQ